MGTVDGGIQGAVKGEAVRLLTQLALQLGDLPLQISHIHTLKRLQAVLGGVQLGRQVVHLRLQVDGFGFLGSDVPAVFAHQPVQLLVSDAGNLVFYFFTFHLWSFPPALCSRGSHPHWLYSLTPCRA